MLSNAGVNLNDSVQVRNYLNSYYNRNYSYAAYSQVLNGCANQTLTYVLALPGIEAEEAKGGYRFGFGGQEKDNEVFIGAYTAEYWEYDSRLGRRWNVDPVVQEWESPYACFHNNPITHIDPDGSTPGLVWGLIKGFFRKKENREFANRSGGLLNRLKESINEGARTGFNEVKIIVGLIVPDFRRGFWGGAQQLISRFTWELPQTLYGLAYGLVRNWISHVDDVMWANGTTYLTSLNIKEDHIHMIGNVMIGKSAQATDYYNEGWEAKARISRTFGPLYFIYQIIDGFSKRTSWENNLIRILDAKYNRRKNRNGYDIHGFRRDRIRKMNSKEAINLIQMKHKHKHKDEAE